jgi:GNAT superfamily N-acetyltransferase
VGVKFAAKLPNMNPEFVTFKNTFEHHQIRAELTNTLYKNHLYTAEQGVSEMEDAQPDPRVLMEMVRLNGRWAACFEAVPFDSEEFDLAFFIDLIVHPDLCRQGLGTKALERIEAHCRSFEQPAMLEVQVRENWAAHLNFYLKHGFAAQPATLWYALNPQEYTGASRVPDGIRIENWATCQSKISPTDLLALRNGFARESFPSFPNTQKPWTPEFFQQEVLGAHHFKPEHLFVALEQHQLVGVLLCTGYDQDPTFFLEFGGVALSARRKGIATALMQHAIAVAKQQSFTMLEVHLDAQNNAVQAVFEHLGFTRQPGYVCCRKFV